MPTNCNQASRHAEADRRRQLEGNTRFKDLGEPIQKLLLRASKDVTDGEIEMLSKITVRQIAKVFDMLAMEEDPDKILERLKRDAGIDCEESDRLRRRAQCNEGAANDAIAFYKELERKNLEVAEEMKKAADEREIARQANVAARAKRREEVRARAVAEKERALAAGEHVDAVNQLRKSDRTTITAAFDRFNTTADNTGANQDCEWWKQDEYRRDFEKNGRKGKMWTRVIEGGSQRAIDADVDSREQWYRSYCWWKGGKYKRDWLASRDAEWWKEESYIRDWQENGQTGAMWTAADEVSGFNKKGDRRPAAGVELGRRVEWYKNNGPKGIVKLWCALAEGTFDRCTLEEKRERVDYYKNGDWWRSADLSTGGITGSAVHQRAVTFAGPAGADREWWKTEEYRRDFLHGGARWKKLSEKAAVLNGDDDTATATEMEQQKRAEWFEENWWKADKYRRDFCENGENGKLWRSNDEADTTKPKAKPCRDSEARQRAEWYRSAEDVEWWKAEQYIRDWTHNGGEGKLWTAAWADAANVGAVPEGTAQQMAEREAWFKQNWWKQEKYVKDFQMHGTMWRLAAAKDAAKDADWWMQSEYVRKHAAKKKAEHCEFWKQPHVIDDYFNNGAIGKMWQGVHAAAAAQGKGLEAKAPEEEVARRRHWYEENWFLCSEAVRDFAAHSNTGSVWTATVHPKRNANSANSANSEGAAIYVRAGADELAARRAALDKASAATPGATAMLEVDAVASAFGTFADHDTLAQREEEYRKNWWKSKAVRDDFKARGAASPLLRAATMEAAALGSATDESLQATPAEIQERVAFFTSGTDDTVDGEWWTDDSFRKEYAANREPVFWKNSEFIEDFLANGDAGKKWTAADPAAGSCGKGDMKPASAEELAERKQWLQTNFWKAPQYQHDFFECGDDGALWTTVQPNGEGATVSEVELKSRAAFFKPTQAWQLKSKPQSSTGKLRHCGRNEELEREAWVRLNWWKAADIKANYEKHGAAAPLLKAGSREAIDLGVYTDPTFQASPEEIEERIAYFEEATDTEWWKSPAIVQNFVEYGTEGAMWQARTQKESQMSMGGEFPVEKAELTKRQVWFEENFWKAPESIEAFHTHGHSSSAWKRNAKGDDSEASADELAKRDKWLEQHTLVDPAEEARRKEWMARQLTDEEKVFRRGWLSKQSEETKKIYADELGDVLAALNDGHQPTEEQLNAIEECVSRRRRELGIEDVKGEDAHITREEFVAAVADIFYVPATAVEAARVEQDVLELRIAEEMALVEEGAAFLAMEAEEELAAAGANNVDDAAADDEEAAFLDNMEEDNYEHISEGDLELTAEEEAMWAEYLAGERHADEITAEEEERLAAEAAAAEAYGTVADDVNAERDGDEEDEEGEEGEELPLALADAKEQMGDLMDDEGVESFDDYDNYDDEEEGEEEEVYINDEPQPVQWKLPLPEVTNPQYLKSYFTVTKFTPGRSLLGSKQKRVWVVDHFTKCFYNLDKSGKIKKEHAANKLLQLERNVTDALRLRLMFFDASHSYELQFYSPQERERFYETASAIRPSIRVYAPDLTNQDQSVEACTTTIDGVAANTVTVTCANAAGKQVTRELTGECKINASKLLTEPLTIWTGTFNLSGHHPPRNSAQLQEWMPKDKYDIYAVGVQEASYRREENDWFEYLQHYLGRDYLTLASMSVWDTQLIVFSRKKHLLKITNVEGSTKSTVHKAICGTKGGIGISLRYLETSLCFVTCHLAARLERTAMRNTNVEEIIDGLQVGIRETDICNQFNHVFWFGDFNYRIELDGKQSEKLLAEKNYAELLNYDQLTMQRNEAEGILHGFIEPPITFPPTYRMQVGTDKYMAEKGNSASYCSRVLTRSMANTWVKCTGYRACKSVMVSEHQPVNATFIIRCVRPTMSCFMKQQQPIPSFVFEDVQLIESTCPVMKKPQLLFRTGFTGGFKPIDATSGNTESPVWANDKLPALTAVMQAQEYLETSHIIMILREGAEKREDKAHRGTCHVTLFSRVIGMQDVAQDFDAEVICHGRLVGKLTGKMRWEAAPVAQ